MSEQPPQYQVGDVVNGHRWTGSNWEPVGTASPESPGQPMQTMTAPAPDKKPWYKKWWGIGIIVLGILIVIGLLFGGGSDTTTATDEPAASETSAPEEPATEGEEPAPAEEAAAGIGTPVRDGKFEFTVTNVQPGVAEVGPEFVTETAQGSYTLVSMKIENIGDEPQTFFSDNVKGTDSQGRQLSSDSMATLVANENNNGWIDEINPGNFVEAIVVFDVAAGEQLVSITVQDSAFSGGAEIKLQ